MATRRDQLVLIARIAVIAILPLIIITVLGTWIIDILDNPGSLPWD